jgi:hypothetical protein
MHCQLHVYKTNNLWLNFLCLVLNYFCEISCLEVQVCQLCGGINYGSKYGIPIYLVAAQVILKL